MAVPAHREDAALVPFLTDGLGDAARFEAEPAWLTGRRTAAAARFARTGMPSARLESWKRTPLALLTRRAFGPPPAAVAVDAGLPAALAGAAARLVFVNGRHRPELSDVSGLPAGATLLPFGAAAAADDGAMAHEVDRQAGADHMPLADVAAARMDGGWVLRLAAGTALARPVEILHVGRPGSDPAAWFPRVLVLAGEAAEATVLERHVGAGAYLACGVAEFVLAQGAILKHVRLQDEAADAVHLQHVFAEVGRDARLDAFSLNLGGGFSRAEAVLRLTAPGAEVHWNGAFALRGSQHADQITRIHHDSGRTASSETIKGVLDDRAHGVFQGLIQVPADSQKIQGHQLCKAMLLSRQAQKDTKPELEILADDVVCCHGAATGQLDPAQLFYAVSRGIPESEARAMLVEGFLSEAVRLVPDEALADLLNRRLADWLAGAAEDHR